MSDNENRNELTPPGLPGYLPGISPSWADGYIPTLNQWKEWEKDAEEQLHHALIIAEKEMGAWNEQEYKETVRCLQVDWDSYESKLRYEPQKLMRRPSHQSLEEAKDAAEQRMAGLQTELRTLRETRDRVKQMPQWIKAQIANELTSDQLCQNQWRSFCRRSLDGSDWDKMTWDPSEKQCRMPILFGPFTYAKDPPDCFPKPRTHSSSLSS